MYVCMYVCIKGQKLIAVREFALVRENNNCADQLGELNCMGMREQQTRSITTCMSLKHRRE